MAAPCFVVHAAPVSSAKQALKSVATELAPRRVARLRGDSELNAKP